LIENQTENIEAELVEANDDFVILSWKAREPKRKVRRRYKKTSIALWRYKRSNCYSNILIKEFAWKT
jgi:hypothetical protein